MLRNVVCYFMPSETTLCFSWLNATVHERTNDFVVVRHCMQPRIHFPDVCIPCKQIGKAEQQFAATVAPFERRLECEELIEIASSSGHSKICMCFRVVCTAAELSSPGG